MQELVEHTFIFWYKAQALHRMPSSERLQSGVVCKGRSSVWVQSLCQTNRSSFSFNSPVFCNWSKWAGRGQQQHHHQQKVEVLHRGQDPLLPEVEDCWRPKEGQKRYVELMSTAAMVVARAEARSRT